MPQANVLLHSLKSELAELEELVSYLEDRGALGAKEYLYCQAKLRDTVKRLERLEYVAGSS